MQKTLDFKLLLETCEIDLFLPTPPSLNASVVTIHRCIDVSRSGFIQKVESQIQEHSRTFLGGNFFSGTFPARHPHILFTILSTEQFRLVKQSRSQKLVL